MSAKKIAVCVTCRKRKPILGRGMCVTDYFKMRAKAIAAGTWKPQARRSRETATEKSVLHSPSIVSMVESERSGPFAIEVGREGRVSLMADALVTLIRPGIVVVLVKGHGISGSLILPDDVAQKVLIGKSLT